MNHVGSSVNLHIVVNGKILLLRRISQRWMHGKLQIPGGHVDEGESPMQAVLREAHEELGIKAGPADVTLASTVAVREGEAEYFALQFRLINPEKFTFRIMEPQKCSELIWADIHKLPDDTIDLFRIIIDQAQLNGQTYIEMGY